MSILNSRDGSWEIAHSQTDMRIYTLGSELPPVKKSGNYSKNGALDRL